MADFHGQLSLRAEHRTKDMATLGRAGFSYETARRVIDGA